MPFVSITRARVRAWKYWPVFNWYSFRSAFDARKAAGVEGVWVMGDANRAFWTCTIWRSEQAMRAFMGQGPHLQAMKRISTWCDEGAVAHWTQESYTPPTWDEAHRRLLSEGRPSRLKEPSKAQLAFQVPKPMPLPLMNLRFKTPSGTP
jgi:Domain of unknown function (DUF3291)